MRLVVWIGYSRAFLPRLDGGSPRSWFDTVVLCVFENMTSDASIRRPVWRREYPSLLNSPGHLECLRRFSRASSSAPQCPDVFSRPGRAVLSNVRSWERAQL